MSKIVIRLINIFLILLMTIAVIMAGIFYFGNMVPGTEGTALEEPVITDTFIRFAELLVLLTAVVTLVFALVNVFSSWKSLRSFLLVIAGVAVLIFVAYSLASDSAIRMAVGTFDNKITLKWTDTGLYTTYMLMGLAVLAIVYSEVAKYFK